MKQAETMSGFYSFFKLFPIFLSSIICFIAGSLTASESDVRFLRGLIDRGLFDSVEYFCTKEFQKSNDSIREKYVLATELLRCRSRQLLLETPARQKEIQRSIDELERRFLGKPDDFSNPEDSFARIFLQFQGAIAVYSLGDWQRLDADGAAQKDHGEKIKKSRETLLDSLNRFESCLENGAALRKKLGQNIRLVQEQQLLALERSICFQQGLAQMSYALTFPTDQNEQSDSSRFYSLNRAVEILTKIASLQIDDSIVVQSQIELATCYRLLGNLSRCQEILTQLNQGRNADNIQFQTELLRYSIAVGDLNVAMDSFYQGRIDSAVYPDYDLARIELFLAFIKYLRTQSTATTENETKEKQLSNAILQLIQKIESESGPYWGRRAGMLLSNGNDKEQLENQVDPEMLVILAEDRFRNGHHADSIELFDRASRLYELAGRPENAFACSRSSLGVLAYVLEKVPSLETVSEKEKQKCRRQLVEQLRNVSTRFFVQNEASELHLKAIDLTAEDLLEQKISSDQYLDLLREHVGTWPDSAKIPPLLLRAALLLERQGKQKDAIELIARIPNKNPNALEAINMARRCFGEMISVSSTSTKKETLDILKRKAEWFEKRLPADKGQWTEADSQSAFMGAEARLQIASQYSDLKTKNDSLQHAERLLRSALRHGTQQNAKDKAPFQALLITTLNESGKKQEAAALLQSFNNDLLDKLPPAEKVQFKQVQVRLLSEIGNTQEAIDILTELLKQDSKNLSYWKLLAEILSKQPSSETQTKALQIWIQIERNSEKGSEFWWSAREGIIESLLKQGNVAEAKKSYDLLQLLYPDLGSNERKQRLERKLNHPAP